MTCSGVKCSAVRGGDVCDTTWARHMRTHSNCVFMSKMATERLTLRAYTMKNPKKAITAKKCRLPVGVGVHGCGRMGPCQKMID
jgi:hypothetical protein